jgi:hypothetical protein
VFGRIPAHGKSPVAEVLNQVLAMTVLFGIVSSSCSSRPQPESLLELRRVLSVSTVEQDRHAAADLMAEAERSLEMAEHAFTRGDEAMARRMAMLGVIQVRIARALARQHDAAARAEKARHELTQVQESISRSKSQQADALREIRRLESLGHESKTRAGTCGPPPSCLGR